jgi:anaerobic magnesium-protoporphyrin IX monomethyl ester cyclase
VQVALVEVRSNRKECVNKDFMGGYGWAFKVGRSLPARTIEFVKRHGERVPIMAFGYLAAIFRRAGHLIRYTNDVVTGADLAIIYSSMVDYRADLEVAQRYRRLGTSVAFVGPFASNRPEEFLSHADVVVSGEPEHFALSVARGDALARGLVESRDVQNLDDLPFPDWSGFPVGSYSYFPALRQRPFLPMLSSRGCPYTCEYCPYEIIRWRPRSIPNVLEEMAYLRRDHNIRALLFRDPVFSLRRKRAVELAEGMLRQSFDLRWACETRMDCLDVELLELLHRAGLRVLNVAVESANEAVLKDVARKPIPVRHQEEILAACDRLGIRATVFYVLGLPEDTEASIRETIRYAKRLNTHVAQFFVFTPFPGTPLYERVKGDIAVEDWEAFDCYTPVIRHPHLSAEEILRLKEWAFVSYYYRPAWLARLAWRALRDVLG